MNKFLLLLGPSGVGKSTIIKELRATDDRFVYISPYITRPLREGETDKISVSNETMDEMASRGEFLVINEIYGIRYATPKQPILDALDGGKFPVLDWPVHRIGIMEEAFGGRLYRVYVSPPNLEELRVRIDKDGRDKDGSRYNEASKELARFWAGEYDGICDLKIVSRDGQIPELSGQIYAEYRGIGKPKERE